MPVLPLPSPAHQVSCEDRNVTGVNEVWELAAASAPTLVGSYPLSSRKVPGKFLSQIAPAPWSRVSSIFLSLSQ